MTHSILLIKRITCSMQSSLVTLLLASELPFSHHGFDDHSQALVTIVGFGYHVCLFAPRDIFIVWLSHFVIMIGEVIYTCASCALRLISI